jgi:hypothetical protein
MLLCLMQLQNSPNSERSPLMGVKRTASQSAWEQTPVLVVSPASTFTLGELGWSRSFCQNAGKYCTGADLRDTADMRLWFQGH